jgi:hypothetical protein
MADAPADAEGAPDGRKDPGGMKIMGFPWWVWAIAAGGTFAVVWYLRSKSSTSVTNSTQTGAASGTNPALGVTQMDPMTAAALLQAMQDLATRLGANSVAPPPPVVTPPWGNPFPNAIPLGRGVNPGPMTGPPGIRTDLIGLPVSGFGGGAATSHTTGGSSTALTTVPGIPAMTTRPLSRSVFPANSTSLQPR